MLLRCRSDVKFETDDGVGAVVGDGVGARAPARALLLVAIPLTQPSCTSLGCLSAAPTSA